MANETLEVLVTRKMPDGSFSVIDALRGLHVVRDGFKTADDAVRFIEDFYIARGVLKPRESKQ